MKKKFKLSPMLLLAIAAVLLLASTVGSTQAALTYYSDNYVASIETLDIGTKLIENGNPVETDEVLMENLLEENEKLVPGKTYDEEIQVGNTGEIDSYVRVLIKKYWVDESGDKDSVKLNPEFIELIPAANGKWIKSEASTTEREIFYYTDVLKGVVKNENGEVTGAYSTEPVITGVRIDEQISKEVIQYTNGNKVSYEYKYNGCKFVIEVEAQTVQTHNAEAAIKSAWGVDATITDGKLSVK